MRLRLHGHAHTDDGPRHRTRIAPPHPHAVADRADPVVAVEDSGRDRNRPALLPGRLLRGHPAGQRRGARRASRTRWPEAELLEPAHPAARVVDRRRPRRQPERHRRRGAPGHRSAPPIPRWSTTSPRSPRSKRSCRCRRGLVKVSDELAALADACHEPARADEPYRRALRVIHGRLTATATEILDRPARTRTRPRLRALPAPRRSCWPTSTSSTRRCAPTAARCSPTTGWPGCGKPCTSSVFTSAGLDMRQNSDVHEEVVAELLAWAGVHPDYRSLPEPDRVELLVAELAPGGP